MARWSLPSRPSWVTGRTWWRASRTDRCSTRRSSGPAPSGPLVVGDRLDTDIEGANRCDADSLLVMTGVTDPAALCRARPVQRPSYVAWTLEGLLSPHELPSRRDGAWVLDDWAVSVTHHKVQVESKGTDRESGLRVVALTAWEWYDHLAAADSASTAELDIDEGLDALRLP